MGRKKGKRQVDPSRDECESTDSEGGFEEGQDVKGLTSCPHVGKAVQFSNIKKNLKIAWVRVGQCSTCLKNSKATSAVKKDAPKVKRELGGKLTLQEIKKEQLERAKAEQRAASEKLKKEREGKTEDKCQILENPAELSGKEVKSEESSTGKTAPQKGEVAPEKKIEVESNQQPVKKEEVTPEKPTVWLCLKCGSQGCGGNISKKHSYEHYKQPRSDLHCLVVNTDSWVIWCYECQQEIYVDSHKKLYEAVEFIKKTKGNPNKNLAMNPRPAPNTPASFGVIKSIGKNGGGAVAGNLPRIKGLNNLGNTCFFNSVMQCLNQTHILTELLDLQVSKGVNFFVPGTFGSSSLGSNVDDVEEGDNSVRLDTFPDLDIKLSEGGPMVTSLAAFFKDMHNSNGKSASVSPGHLFGQVVRQSPKFRGMQQQDSHELLRYLMDGMKNEEVRRQKTAILKNFGLTEKTDPKLVAKHLRRKLQAYGRMGSHTLLDKIFSGQMVSTIVCEECHHSSQNYEQFLDLSLPVVEDKPSKPNKKNSSPGFVLPDDDGSQVTCCGTQEGKKTKGQVKKEKERRRKEKAKQLKIKNADDQSGREIKEELQGLGEFMKVELVKTESMVERENLERKETVAANWKDKYDGDEGNEEDEEEDIQMDEKEDWGWDYGEPWEDKQVLKKHNSKFKCDLKDEDSDYIEVNEEVMRKESSEFPDKCSDRTGENSAEENETGASVNGDIEDNDLEDDEGRWILSKNLLNNLHKLDDLMIGNENLDPHMQELCREISSIKLGNPVVEDNGSGDQSLSEKDKRLAVEEVQRQHLKHEWTARTLSSLAPRYQASSGECSLYSCLNNFTQSELLTGPNKWACDSCTDRKKASSDSSSDSSKSNAGTVYSSASKQLLLFSPPAILTLHLKRFQQTLSGCKKVNKHVTFPLELDLAAFCSSTAMAMPTVSLGQKQVLYSLYGVVEHSGRLQGGHYTAFVKVRAANAGEQPVELSRFFSSPVSKASDVPSFLEEIQSKLKNRTLCDAKLPKDEEKTIETAEDETNNNGLKPAGNKLPCRWFHASDTSVSEVSEEKVLKCQAYLLFYERIL